MKTVLLSLILSFPLLLKAYEVIPKFDDPEVLNDIVSQAVELEEVVVHRDGQVSIKLHEPLRRSPYTGDGWGIVYHTNGKIKSLRQLEKGMNHGCVVYWDENGQKIEESIFQSGLLDGLQKKWHKNGTQSSEIIWKNNTMHGLASMWYDNGVKMSKGTLKGGKLKQL